MTEIVSGCEMKVIEVQILLWPPSTIGLGFVLLGSQLCIEAGFGGL